MEMEIPAFEMERTITFEEAMSRVKDLYPLVNQWQAELKRLLVLRNDVTHYGANKEKASEYCDMIATVAVPFLTAFLQESSDISLEQLVSSSVFHELEVAKTVCERLKKEKKEDETYALNTVEQMMRYTYISARPKLDMDDEFELVEQTRRAVQKDWGDGFIETTCRICSSTCFVKVETLTPARRDVEVTAVICGGCDLLIRESELYLAACHVGALPPDKIEAHLRELGE
jgi:hypothetical protein